MMYGALSRVYDVAMEDAPYALWFEFLNTRFADMSAKKWADVGCGTGTLTRQIAKSGALMIGVDQSEEMLSVAASEAVAERLRISFLQQDMRDLRLPQLVDILISSCDCVNYLLDIHDVQSAFQKFYENLELGGYLVFDVLGPRRIDVLENGQWHDIGDQQVIVYETDVSEDGHISYDVHAFVSEDGVTYERFEEHHDQQFYHEPLLVEMLTIAGFCEIECFGDFGLRATEDADRIVFVARAGNRAVL